MEQILFNPLLQMPKTTFLFASTNKFQASAILIALQAASSRPKLLPENHCYARRTELPLGPSITHFPLQNRKLGDAHVSNPEETEEKSNLYNVGIATVDESEWSPNELEAIATLFQRRMPEEARKHTRERSFPLPSPYQKCLQQIPTPKHHIRLAARETLSARSSFTDQVYKNPEALIHISRQIASLPPEVDASEVLDEWSPFLRKGSLSIIIRELGHLGLPKCALETLCWVQKQRPFIFPDDHTLSSTIEVLARNGEPKIESELEMFLNSASHCVVEAMVRGFIKGGNLSRTQHLLVLARDSKRTLDPSLHAKLILKSGKTPNGYKLVLALLDELGERESLDLKPQDTTTIMKVCIKLGRFETVE